MTEPETRSKCYRCACDPHCGSGCTNCENCAVCDCERCLNNTMIECVCECGCEHHCKNSCAECRDCPDCMCECCKKAKKSNNNS